MSSSAYRFMPKLMSTSHPVSASLLNGAEVIPQTLSPKPYNPNHPSSVTCVADVPSAVQVPLEQTPELHHACCSPVVHTQVVACTFNMFVYI